MVMFSDRGASRLYGLLAHHSMLNLPRKSVRVFNLLVVVAVKQKSGWHNQ